jgi:flagellar biosynthesis/type III secretory pathway chaperone
MPHQEALEDTDMTDTAQLLVELDRTLLREIQAYENLLQLQHAEKRFAVAQTLEPFLTNLQAKERLARTIAALENTRYAVCAELSAIFEFSDPTVTLQQLSTRVGPPFAKKLLSHRTRLYTLVMDLQRCNRQNEILLRDSLAFIDSALTFFAYLVPDTLTYHQSGTYTPQTQGRLISGRV